MIFTDEARQKFDEIYPHAPAKLTHTLAGDGFFTLERLAELAGALPAAQVEYNRGDLPVGIDPDKTPSNGLSAAETVRSIEENGSWLVLKNVEKHPDWSAKLDECLAGIRDIVEEASGEMFRREAFVFVTSPNSVTPFHMDPEHNILMQIRGSKQMRIYDLENVLTPEMHEAFHNGGHRNLSYKPEYDARSELFELQPGDGVHVPVKRPHWVQNGPEVSISFSITWRSTLSVAEADLHRMNAWLRERGLKPHSRTGLRRNVKVGAFRLLNRAGVIAG